MDKNLPLVSIGIPTYNRAALLSRSIESVLSQDYKNIEVLVSDNASTDETEAICQLYCGKDDRFKYIRQTNNRGAAINFSDVLNRASGQFFMWLGDDDWIDANYVSSCVQQLICDPAISLVCGTSEYYQNSQKVSDGKLFSLLHEDWWLRVVLYYVSVTDNGMFYGLMRTSQIRQIDIQNTMGGDWILIANIVSFGKAKTISAISVHRELGGATISYRQIVKSLGLPAIQAVFPMSAIAWGAFKSIVYKGDAYKKRGVIARVILACVVFLLVLARPCIQYANKSLKNTISKLWHTF